MLSVLGVGASTTWKESINGTGLLEWFAWSKALEINIEWIYAFALQAACSSYAQRGTPLGRCKFGRGDAMTDKSLRSQFLS